MVAGWIGHPLGLALRAGTIVTELPTRDPRIPLALLAALALLRRPDAARGLAVFALAGFAVWEARFSVLRYLAPIELISGLLPALVLQRLAPRAVLPAMTAWLLILAGWTVYPHWERLPPGARYQVAMPALPADAMVLMLDQSPISYLALYQPVPVRFIAANNNVVSLDPDRRDDALLARVRAIIAAHGGPLYGLDMPQIDPVRSEAAMRFYDLTRSDCVRLHTNLDGELVRLCRLSRSTSSG